MSEVAYGYCQCGCGGKTRVAQRTHTKDHMVKGEPMRYCTGHGRRISEGVRQDMVASHSGICGCGCGGKTPLAKHTSMQSSNVIGFPIRFIPGHEMKGRKQSLSHRVSRSMGITGREPVFSPFLEGVFVNYNKKGNRWFCLDPNRERINQNGKSYATHAKVVYEHFCGPVPPGYEVHHKNGDASKLEYDAPENLMLLPQEWNMRYFPVLSRGFRVPESVVTEVYLSLKDRVPDDMLFSAICLEMSKKDWS